MREYYPTSHHVRLLKLTPTSRNTTAAIDKLSDDCLLEIFRVIRPVTPPFPSYGEFYCRTLIVQRLMMVCKRWWDTLDSRPSFWNVIFLTIRHGYSIRQASRWLRRAGTAPLHIFIRGGLMEAPPTLGHPDFVVLMRSLSPQICSLSLLEPDPEICRLFSTSGAPTTSPTGSPSPSALQSITSLSLDLGNGNHTSQQLVQLLNQTPRLLTLSIGNFLEDGPTSYTASLPHLRQLTLSRSHRRVLNLLEFPPGAAIRVRLNRLPYQDQPARDRIIAEYLPLSFSTSTTVFFTVTEGNLLVPYLSIHHEDAPAGRQCYIHLAFGDDCSYANLSASFLLVTEAIKNLGCVDTIHLDIQFILLPESLVPWIAGFSNLQVLRLAGTYVSQVLTDPLFAEVGRFPRLQTIALERTCPKPVITQVVHWLAERERGGCPVKLELHTA